MKKLVFNFENDSEFSQEDLMMMGGFLKDMAETLVENLGEEIIDYIEKDQELSIALYCGGCMFGMAHKEIPQSEIAGKPKQLHSMAKHLVKELRAPSMETFEKFSEIYTQIMVQGIYFAQDNDIFEY